MSLLLFPLFLFSFHLFLSFPHLSQFKSGPMPRGLLNSRKILDHYDPYQKSNSTQAWMHVLCLLLRRYYYQMNPTTLLFLIITLPGSSEAMRPQSQSCWTIFFFFLAVSICHEIEHVLWLHSVKHGLLKTFFPHLTVSWTFAWPNRSR